MNLLDVVALARQLGASDIHLEPALSPALRIDGALRPQGPPTTAEELRVAARQILGDDGWKEFAQRRSADLSVSLGGNRCRVNILQTARGVGLAIRLLSPFVATLEKLNVHPDLHQLTRFAHGLVLVSGPTGSGKSTTLAAFIQELNLSEPRHIITLESPIEYVFTPRKALIRQREVGKDTPSFEQGLIDALREDPDVLMVGEMRDPTTMRLTLSASETGHLVYATVHSSSTTEALQRVVASFPAEIQSGVRAMLADCLQAVLCQRLRYRPDLRLRVPECEVLLATHAVRNFVRQGEFFRIQPLIEMGAEHGMWTFDRYQRWLDQRREWHLPAPAADPSAASEISSGGPAIERAPQDPPLPGGEAAASTAESKDKAGRASGPIEIEPVDGGMAAVLRRLAR